MPTPAPDDEPERVIGDRNIFVRCMNCGVDYTTAESSFVKRTCSCPCCDSHKAQNREL